MKINATLTIQIKDNTVELRIRDEDAATQFLTLELQSAEFMRALGRLASRPCILAELHGFDRVGKRHENKTFEFKLSTNDWMNKKNHAAAEVREAMNNEGLQEWVPDLYFGRQDSFFRKGDEQWARCNIRRWMAKEDDDV